MKAFYLIPGVTVLVLVTADLLTTVLWLDGGAGPISSRLTTGLWRQLRRISSSHRSRLLSLAGPIVLVATLLMWVILLWTGWTFVFAAGEGAIVDTVDNEPLTWTGRIYYVGYTIFTLGIGDYVPADGVWQVITSITAGTGMLFITLSVSYVVSVVAAVVQKRGFARSVTGIGSSASAVATAGWNGEDFRGLDSFLGPAASQVGTLVEQHRAYPILHYYHSEKSENASAVAAVILDEALTLMRLGVPEQYRPNAILVEQTRSSIEAYLGTLESAYIQPADRTPPRPDLEELREAGLPTVSDQEFNEAVGSLEDRRRKLLGLIEADAWRWSLVHS